MIHEFFVSTATRASCLVGDGGGGGDDDDDDSDDDWDESWGSDKDEAALNKEVEEEELGEEGSFLDSFESSEDESNELLQVNNLALSPKS